MFDLSIIIPTYNEEKNIPILYEKLKEILNKESKTYELIFVNDGSTDQTFDGMQKLKKNDKNIKIINFQRNFGKAAGLSAGWKFAQGKIIIQMDADLQDDPEEIPKFLSKLDSGYDLISGWKYNRLDPLEKRIFTKPYNFLNNWVAGTKIHDHNCGFKCYRREVIENIDIYGELHRYIPALATWRGFKVTEIKVKHHKRKFGKSKYGMGRIFKGFMDLITVKYITTYNKKPLHFFGLIGSLFSFLGFISGLYLVYLKIIGKTIGDRPLLFLTILLIFLGVQFISLGLIAEMITHHSKKEEYVIKEVIE